MRPLVTPLTTANVLSAQGGAAWLPANLGSSLLAWWDAEDASTLELSGSTVTTWTDKKNGYAAGQATTGSKPVYSATALYNRPALIFDGADDFLSMELQPFPSASAPVEIWALVDQQRLGSAATGGVMLAYGGIGSPNRRVLFRAQGANASSVVYCFAEPGQTGTAGDLFNGIHIARLRFDGSVVQAQIDDVAPSSSPPGTATTGNSRTRIGSNTADTPTSFFQGSMNSILVTSLLSSGEASSLRAFLKSRGGIA